jgi:hypothetical protein
MGNLEVFPHFPLLDLGEEIDQNVQWNEETNHILDLVNKSKAIVNGYGWEFGQLAGILGIIMTLGLNKWMSRKKLSSFITQDESTHEEGEDIPMTSKKFVVAPIPKN